jgi:hypothetical protein
MADPTFEAELRVVLEEGASNTCASPTEAPGAPRSRFAVISVPLKRCSSYFLRWHGKPSFVQQEARAVCVLTFKAHGTQAKSPNRNQADLSATEAE